MVGWERGRVIEHLERLRPSLETGGLIPFLGAGVNASARPQDPEALEWDPDERYWPLPWEPGAGVLPPAVELAVWPADRYRYPSRTLELTLVAEWISINRGRRRLYEDLHEIFRERYEPTTTHVFFAKLARWLWNTQARSNLVLVTTNYDVVMERAFDSAQVPYHVVWYEADGEERGKFWHRHVDGEVTLIGRTAEYRRLDPEYPILVKMHGYSRRLRARSRHVRYYRRRLASSS